jgi:ferrous iron transport protein B
MPIVSKELKIALAGNPNSGKSSLFNALTGLKQKVGNYPGVTIDRKSAIISGPNGESIRLLDIPGIYSLSASSEDEKIASSILTETNHPDRPDRVILVADATQLRRSMLLCTQIMDLGYPVVLALNMSDLLGKATVEIEEQKLARLLGIPVVHISALNRKGMQELLKAACEPEIQKPTTPFFNLPPTFHSMLAAVKNDNPGLTDYHLFHLAMEEGENENAKPLRSNEVAVRYDRISELLKACTTENPSGKISLTRRLDKVLLHPVLGYVFFIAILALVFQAIFSWAEYPMNAIEFGFGKAAEALRSVMLDNFLTTLLTDGLIAGIGGIIVFVPQIALLFFFISLLEDTGYMSRVVFLMDRIMRPFGFSGRSVIPLIGGMACAIPSIMMARTIPNRVERTLTIMVIPLMSCSARIPVYVLLIGLFVPSVTVLGFLNLQGLVMTGMYLLGFVMALLAAWVIGRVMKSSTKPLPFLTELPRYRTPRWKNALLVMYGKCKTFVFDAGKVIIVISLLLTVLISFGPRDERELIVKKYDTAIAASGNDTVAIDSLVSLKKSALLKSSYAGKLGQVIEPVIRPMGFDWKIGISLISSFAAREVFVGTMNTIYSAGDQDNEESGMKSLRAKMRAEINPETGKPVYTTAVAISLLIFYAFAMQCMSTLAVTKRETGSWKLTFIMLIYLTGLAYVAATIAYQLITAIWG